MKTLADLSEEEFDQMLDNMSKPEYDALTSEEFFKIPAAIDAADTLELSAHNVSPLLSDCFIAAQPDFSHL